MDSLTITVENRYVIIDTCEGDTQVMIDFCILECLNQFMSNNRKGENPWEQMISWDKPVAALKKIGESALILGKYHSDQGKRVFFQGCDKKRQKVYALMLKKHGIKRCVTNDEDGDSALEIFF